MSNGGKLSPPTVPPSVKASSNRLLPNQVEVVEAVPALWILDPDHGRVAIPRGRLLDHRDRAAALVLHHRQRRVRSRHVHRPAIGTNAGGLSATDRSVV